MQIELTDREVEILATAMFTFTVTCETDDNYMAYNKEGEADYKMKELRELESKMLNLELYSNDTKGEMTNE